MSEEEFDLMDLLYFIQPFENLVVEAGIYESEVHVLLEALYKKGFVKTVALIDGEPAPEPNWDSSLRGIHFLATKEGLFAHNLK